jgi:hypothetical protein
MTRALLSALTRVCGCRPLLSRTRDESGNGFRRLLVLLAVESFALATPLSRGPNFGSKGQNQIAL